jgi:hypothetical protein
VVLDRLIQMATSLRKSSEKAFADDTRAPGYGNQPPSSGHCAVVAGWAHKNFGWPIATVKFPNGSHWINYVECNNVRWYVDLTADQFGFPPIYITVDPQYPNKPRPYRKNLGEGLMRRITLFDSRMGDGKTCV